MKKWNVMLAAGIMILTCTSCGTQTANVGEKEVQVESSVIETAEENDETADNSTVEPTETESAATQGEAEEKNSAAADLDEKAETGEAAEFAEKIKAAVADRNLAALADLCSYPLAVNGEVIETKEAFLELGEETIFTEERCAAIGSIDSAAVGEEVSMAGIVLGDTSNIIFKSVDGELGIVGIN